MSKGHSLTPLLCPALPCSGEAARVATAYASEVNSDWLSQWFSLPMTGLQRTCDPILANEVWGGWLLRNAGRGFLSHKRKKKKEKRRLFLVLLARIGSHALCRASHWLGEPLALANQRLPLGHWAVDPRMKMGSSSEGGCLAVGCGFGRTRSLAVLPKAVTSATSTWRQNPQRLLCSALPEFGSVWGSLWEEKAIS